MGIRKITRPAVFVDRDGVLNATVLNPATGRMESPLELEDFRLIDGVVEALLRLQGAGYPLILVSNQPNFALGKSSYEMHNRIHHRLRTILNSAGVRFLRFGYCLHHPRGVTPGYSHVCECRKPSPGILLQARDDFSLTLADSWMIGDRPADTRCGRVAGTRTIRIDCGGSDFGLPAQIADPCADYFARNLTEAAQIILGNSAGRTTATAGGSQDTGVDLVARGPRIVMKHLHRLSRVLV
jgi:D-glycero-D-manno-heptose 1,7-bisphosphate phosphatase